MSLPDPANSHKKIPRFNPPPDVLAKEKQKLEIRQRRSEMKSTCGNCGKFESPQNRFKECMGVNAKCKALYCSEKCQKAHWPKHRERCKNSTRYYPGLAKSCQTLLANSTFADLVKLLIILELDLLDKPRPGVKCLEVEIIVEFEPTDPMDFMKSFNTDAVVDYDDDSQEVKGMLQVVAIAEGDGDTSGLSQQDHLLNTEKSIRRELEAEGRQAERYTIVFVNFWRVVGGQCQGIKTSIAVTERDLALVKEIKKSGIAGEKGENVPVSIASCILTINRLIELDVHNLCLLRMVMQRDDKIVLKDAATAEAPDWLGLLIKRKYVQRKLAIVEDAQAQRK